jgi:hypothetical protein
MVLQNVDSDENDTCTRTLTVLNRILILFFNRLNSLQQWYWSTMSTYTISMVFSSDVLHVLRTDTDTAVPHYRYKAKYDRISDMRHVTTNESFVTINVKPPSMRMNEFDTHSG